MVAACGDGGAVRGLESMEDPLFGEVEVVDGWWYAKHASKWSGDEVHVILPLAGDGPAPQQRRSFQDFIAHESALQEVVERSIFDWYRAYTRTHHGDFDDSLPPIARPEDVWQVLDFTSIHIPETGDARCFEVLFSGDWELEHGYKVAFREGTVVGVMDQGAGY